MGKLVLNGGVGQVNSLHDGAIIAPHTFVSDKRSELMQHIFYYTPLE
jgi:hypothetical protein